MSQARAILALTTRLTPESQPRTVAVVVQIPGAHPKKVLWRREPMSKSVLLTEMAMSVDSRVREYVQYFDISEIHFIDDRTNDLWWLPASEWEERGYEGNHGERPQWYVPLRAWNVVTGGGYDKTFTRAAENLDDPQLIRFAPEAIK